MMIRAIGAAALLGMAANMGTADVAQAVPVPPGSLQTLSAGGGADFVDIAPYVGRGLSTRDGSVDGGAGGNDAYDFAHNLLVDGNVYQPGTADLTGQTYSGGTASISGLDVTLQYQADLTDPLLRSFASFTNPTGSIIDTIITWQHNLGADSGTVVRGSSSGDTIFGIDDRWLVTSDSGPSDPITSFYWYGPGAVEESTTLAAMTTTFSAAGNQGPRAEYELSIDPGATVSLLWFSSLTDSRLGLTGGVSAATALIADLDNLAPGNPRLAGLSGAQLAQVANFQFGAQTVPEPGTLTMIGAGLLGIGWLRRRRRW